VFTSISSSADLKASQRSNLAFGLGNAEDEAGVSVLVFTAGDVLNITYTFTMSPAKTTSSASIRKAGPELTLSIWLLVLHIIISMCTA
jgi:hypothetical protein